MTRNLSLGKYASSGDVALVVRCRGRRIATASGPTPDGSWVLQLIAPRDGRPRRGVDEDEWVALVGLTFTRAMDLSTGHDGIAVCPAHEHGHRLDAQRLRSALERGTPSVDVTAIVASG